MRSPETGPGIWKVKTRWFGLLFSLCLFFSSAFRPSSTLARTDVETVPPEVHLRLPPGGRGEAEIHVSLRVGPARRIVVSFRDWDSARSGGAEPAPVGRPSFGAAGWLSTQPRVFELAEGESRTLRLQAWPPPGQAEGGYSAFLVLTSEARGGRSSSPREEVMIPIFIQVGEKKGSTPGVHISAPRTSVYPLSGQVEFLNPGPDYLRIQGELLIRAWTGKEIARLSLPSRILGPGGRETAEFTWEGGPPLGIFYLQARLTSADGDSPVHEGPWLLVMRPWVPVLLLVGLVVAGRGLRWLRQRVRDLR